MSPLEQVQRLYQDKLKDGKWHSFQVDCVGERVRSAMIDGRIIMKNNELVSEVLSMHMNGKETNRVG